jgi:hypothetical protein
MIFSRKSTCAIIGFAMMGLGPTLAVAAKITNQTSFNTVPTTLTGGSFGGAIKLATASSSHFKNMSGDLDNLSASARIFSRKATYFGRNFRAMSGRLNTVPANRFFNASLYQPAARPSRPAYKSYRSTVKSYRSSSRLSNSADGKPRSADRLLVPVTNVNNYPVLPPAEPSGIFSGLYKMAMVASELLQSLVKGLVGA